MADSKIPPDQLAVVPAHEAIPHDSEAMKENDEPQVNWTEVENRRAVRK